MEITPHNPRKAKQEALLSLLPDGFEKGYQELLSMINANPPKADIKARSGYEYIPIGILEDKLDHIFGPLNWEVYDFKWERIFNELVGSLTLAVLHPVRGEWVRRTGAGAAQIRLSRLSPAQDSANKQAKENGLPEPFPLDAGRKIQNGLEMDFPHLKADCLSNAVIGLGKFFGRDLRRKEGEKGYYFGSKAAKAEKMGNMVEKAIEELENAGTIEEVFSIEKKYATALNSVPTWTNAISEAVNAFGVETEAVQ